VFSEIFRAADGFDVVIANPPYSDSEAMTKADAPLRKLIQSSYAMTRETGTSTSHFYERGFRLLGSGEGLSFITPDKWISKPFGDEMRINTTPNIFSILKAGREVFETANVDAIVSGIYKAIVNVLTITHHAIHPIEQRGIQKARRKT